ncbi:hypothetical protein CEP54_006626, partial [Fusarium duplospermum]
MDPLSISASIAGLVALADLVFRYSTKFLKGARNEAEDISHEVKNLSLILHNLSHVAFELEETQSSDGTQQTSNLKPQHLHDCQQLLRRLEKGLIQTRLNLGSTSRIERLQSRLAWPFSSSDTKDILHDMRRHKQTIELALKADSLNNLRLLISRQSESNSKISNMQETVNKIYDIQTSIRVDEKRKQVLEFFIKASPSSELDTNRNLRHNLTGLWLTEGPEFEEWYTKPGSKVWCSGIPGAGKSVLAAAMIDECLQRNAANPYFFCVYRDENTQDPVTILSSLCSQLARQDEKAFLVLEEYYHELTSDRQLQSGPSTKKLTKVLRRMCSSIDRVYIIVDGLDECGKQVEESVESLAALLPYPDDETLNLALLSRDEVRIREIVGSQFQHIEIEAHTEDVQLYVASELKQRIESKKLRLQDLALKDLIMTRLVDGAKGMFRWVACQLDALCKLRRDRDRRKALKKLPPTLFDTYERILAGINDSLEENKQLVQRTLLLISSPYHAHLSLRQICEAISLSDDEEELLDEDIVDGDDIIRLCGSLIRKRKMSSWSGEVGIEFSHFSVQEYLQGPCLEHPTLSAYGVSREKACSLLASLCLDYLTLKNHEQLPIPTGDAEDEALNAMDERDLQRPFYRHAATLWPFYVSEGGNGCCLGRIHNLFQLPKTPSFCLWATTLAAHSKSMDLEYWYIDAMEWFENPSFSNNAMFCNPFHVLRPDFTPLHMAAILGMPDLCDHLLKQGADINVRGKFGTPLHCAIAGLGIFTFAETLRESSGLEGWEWFKWANSINKVGQLLGRRQPCQVLLKAEANPHLCFIDDQKKTCSSLSLAAMSLCDEYGLDTALELIKAGVTIGEEDLVHFQDQYPYVGPELPHHHDEWVGKEIVVSLLSALSPPDQETKGTPRSRLYTETYTWATRIGIKDLDQLSKIQPTAGFSDDEIINLISGWIESNNCLELGRFLQSSRSELVKSNFDCIGGGSLNLAIDHDSLDVLKLLLEHGLDANIVDQAGQTPAHCCWRADSLRMLLEHGASMIVPDMAQETIWHDAAGKGDMEILDFLVGLDVRQEALQMFSLKNETPICSALNNGKKDAVLLLLKHCDSKAFWKSGNSIYRAAAKIGSATILQHLLDVDIEVDGMDNITGNPLHYLPTDAPIECIQILNDLFPLDQRRKKDLKTPLESLLLRTVNEERKLDRQLLEVMLPGAAVSNSKEASILWSFLGLELIRSAISRNNPGTWTWIMDCVSAFITLGIMAKYEEEREESALLPFMSAVTLTFGNVYQMVLEVSEQPRAHSHWSSISDMMQHVMGQSRHWDSVVGKPEATRLLSLAILHNDAEMVSLLIDKGVDMHSRCDGLSPFEFACFPKVQIGERSFALLLKHANPEKMTQGNELFKGCGPLHFCAGWKGPRCGCDWKLEQLLVAGFDPNSPLSAACGSPLAFHISRGVISTAEMLLEAGADPWARGPYPFDAALEAVRHGCRSILEKIAATNRQTPCWDRTWVHVSDNQKIPGGNALHLAALNGSTHCLEFYISRGLLSDLECCGDSPGTPMHHAAYFGRSSTIKFLKTHGGNINAKDRSGLTPLHLAARQRQLGAAKTLIKLGAEHQLCNRGCTPLVYAYANGDTTMVEAIQSSSKEPQESSSTIKSPGKLRLLAEAMRNAILRSDVAACERIQAMGCPIDVEIHSYQAVTPLAVAICHQQDVAIVQWLIDSGATVSTVFPQPHQGQYSTALEAAVSRPIFNSLLHKLLNRFLEEGGSFLDMDRSPLHLAVDNNNIEGLRILLDWLRNTYDSSELNLYGSSRIVETSSSQRETLSAFVNQQDAQYLETPLHVAASENNLEACTVLINGGANIEETNHRNETPLHIAAEHGSLQVAKHLLDCGARTNPLDAWAETPLMSAYRESQWELVDLLAPYCKDMMSTNHVGENGLHFMTMNGLGSARNGASLETFSRCLEQGASLYLRSNDGVAPVHLILASQSAHHLRFLLNRDHRFLRPQETAHWPDEWFLFDIDNLAAISKNLRLVQPFLSKHELCKISGVAETGNHSLLCRAACRGSVQVIESLLALGVDMIEHQCNDHGTPLIAAISRSHLKAVKCLVRNGATAVYGLCQPSDFEVSVRNPDFVIREWLFVGRYLERMRISNVTAETSGKIESWAGVRTARVALKWEWKRRREESIWEYACRRQGILKELRGKIIRCHGEDDSGDDASGDASDNAMDEESSG